MKLQLIMLIMTGSTIAVSAQTEKRTNRYFAWTFHQKNLNINGISVGLASGLEDDDQNVNTNGIRLEAIGMGLLVPLIPSSPTILEKEAFLGTMSTPPSERVNGLNLSASGTVCECLTNGISTGLIGQITRQVNGVSASMMMNFTQKHNGIQFAMFNETHATNGIQLGISNFNVSMNGAQFGVSNYGEKTTGLQIGLFNTSKNLKGIQMGLWNSNQKRKLPILNWNFRG